MMGLIELILVLALVGLAVYLVITYIPMPEMFKTVIMVIVAVVLILFVIRLLGVADIPIGARS